MVLCASHTKSLKNVDFYSPHRHTLGVPPSCLLTTMWNVAQLRILNEYSRYLALSMWGWIQASNDTLTSNPVILSMHLNVLYSPPKNGQNKSKAYFLPRRWKSFRVLFTNFTHSFDIAGSRGNWQKWVSGFLILFLVHPPTTHGVGII